jgi:mRNA interferase RelE/StbE
MLTLLISHNAQKFLDILPPKQFRQVVRKVFALLDNPEPADGKPLKGFPSWRADVGEYCIIYDLQGEVLRLILVGKRNDDEGYQRL